ncbi:MAG: GNAT family N-acetyltransferase [Chloroflexota bacterium]
MPFTQRSYSGEADKLHMAALARQHAQEHLHVVDLPYRLSSWALNDPQNAVLWYDQDQQLAAWAVLQTPFWTVDYACRPSAEAELHPQILRWADQRAREIANTAFGVPAWFVVVFADQAGRIADLEQAGFACQADVGEDSWSKVLLRRPAQEPVKVYQPPAGYTVRPLAGVGEVPGYVALHQAVFESKNMRSEWRAHTLQHPAYQPDLDLVVQAPDGRLAAFCIGWLDETSGAGQVEPLGCHADFRRYALGRVALSHVLQRLQARGAREIFVETDNYRNTAFRLYESFGFAVIQDVLVYRKDYPAE